MSTFHYVATDDSHKELRRGSIPVVDCTGRESELKDVLESILHWIPVNPKTAIVRCRWSTDKRWLYTVFRTHDDRPTEN